MTTYTVVMDDPRLRLDVSANSASDAIQSALLKYIGHKVCGCYSGSRSLGQYEGRIDYEIPPHDALKAEPQKRARTKTDATVLMFSEEEMSGKIKSGGEG